MFAPPAVKSRVDTHAYLIKGIWRVWSAREGRLVCNVHHRQPRRCAPCSRMWCKPHRAERVACGVCKTPEKGLWQLCSLHNHMAREPAQQITTALVGRAGACSPHARAQGGDETIKLASAAGVVRGTLLDFGTETRAVKAIKANGRVRIRRLNHEHVGACSYGVRAGRCRGCIKKRTIKKQAAVPVSRHCAAHADAIKNCRTCRRRFQTCDKHKALIQACVYCSSVS